ncbi:PE-PPE domain-containing protein [Mycobacterium sp. 236(2023)]|uniref:PE-PPE domain-containing protein n=1 Tax=Mycobacterium sp. 236(2023) TaxID=3038163 RepID=UPI00241509DF|nr:PE-PPE domain-containing protein [Mycobacterium sp. 236(2023)]MDG4668749.1 PE-PPE domain-containing protein [Mycobacterium sp. 236(2023)]
MKRLCAAVGVVAVGCAAPGIASASTALILGGAGRYADLTDEELADALGGYFADYDQRVNVPFAGTDDFGESIDAAADSMYEAVYSTPGKKTIGGVSQTAPAIAEVLRRLENDPDAPPPDELDAAMYGAPSPFFYRLSGVEYQPLPETPYNLLVVTAEYDGIADFPDNPFNLLAVVNAVMGYNQLHYPAAFTDISQVPEEYITTTTNSKGGTTTTVLIPTRVLPLLKPLSDVGVSDDAVAYLDKILRPLVDSAYHRPERQSAEPEAVESDRRTLSLVAQTESEAETEAESEDNASQSLSSDTEPDGEAAADADTTDDVSTGRHAKKDAAPRGKHAKADADDKADADADTEGKVDTQRGKHAKADKDDNDDKDDSGSEKAGASDAAA